MMDIQHDEKALNETILDLIAEADVVIYDATFTDDELAKYRGWVHSTWQECPWLCKATNVRVPVTLHHLPARDDRSLDASAAAAAPRFPGAVMARKGDTLVP